MTVFDTQVLMSAKCVRTQRASSCVKTDEHRKEEDYVCNDDSHSKTSVFACFIVCLLNRVPLLLQCDCIFSCQRIAVVLIRPPLLEWGLVLLLPLLL